MATLLAIALLALGVAPARAQSRNPDDTIISAGYFHSCALNAVGAADCWGLDNFQQAVDQAGPYMQISAGGLHSCALTPAGAVDCWGNNDSGQATDRPGPYTEISSGFLYNCALTAADAVDCWGNNEYNQSVAQPGPFIRINAGGEHACALTTAGAADCWGRNDSGQAVDQPGPYTEISAGGEHTCALTAAGAVDCWGNNESEQAVDQPGPYVQVSAGNAHTCALTAAGVADCWGRADEIQPAQAELYTQMSSGGRHSCALTQSGAADCWGNNDSGQAVDQPGPYAPYDDPAAPSYNVTLSTPANAAGWNNASVTLNWNWSAAAGNSLDSTSCAPSIVVSGDGVRTLSATCHDNAGRLTSASYTVRIDATPPTLQPVVSPNPVPRGSQATVIPNAADGLSGLANASCDAVDTRSSGQRTVTCRATDVAGNVASAAASYAVIAPRGGPLPDAQIFLPLAQKR